jgi:hypothetical protein
MGAPEKTCIACKTVAFSSHDIASPMETTGNIGNGLLDRSIKFIAISSTSPNSALLQAK